MAGNRSKKRKKGAQNTSRAKGLSANTTADSNRGVDLVPEDEAVLTTRNSGEDGSVHIGKYLAAGDSKSAVKLAKRFYAKQESPEAEELLVKAYMARIESMRARGLYVEADAIAENVELHHPSFSNQLEGVRLSLAAGAGNLDKIATVLNEPSLSPQRQKMVDSAIYGYLTNIQALANCDAIAADHPLRVAAGALFEAMESVTSGPVESAELSLPEVSRRSPLAAWKYLVRAIGSFYRGDDQQCREYLDRIDLLAESQARGCDTLCDGSKAGVSAPVYTPACMELAVLLRAMIDDPDQAACKRKGPVFELVTSVVKHDDLPLRRALKELDTAFRGEYLQDVIQAVRHTVTTCRRYQPLLLDKIKHHVIVTCLRHGMSLGKLTAAMGGIPRINAYFWRLFAHDVENNQREEFACLFWEQFRKHAVQEGIFSEQGPETVAVYLHMIELLQRIPPDELKNVQVSFAEKAIAHDLLQAFYVNQPEELKALGPQQGDKSTKYFLYPERIFEQICSQHVDSEIYSRWVQYVTYDNQDQKVINKVLERWHEAIPDDSRPLLLLAEAARLRKAFTKALQYLDKAEKCDALNPKVKRARLKMWVSKAGAHLKQKKPHLVEKDCLELDAIPQCQEGDKPAFIVGLRWLAAAQAGNKQAQQECRKKIQDILGNDFDSEIFLMCIQSEYDFKVGKIPKIPKGRALHDSQGRYCLICEEMGLQPDLSLTTEVYKTLKSELSKKTIDTATDRMLALGRVLARDNFNEAKRILFALSGHGLRMGSQNEANFLFLRGQSLPYFLSERKKECFAVVAELARRQRNMELAAQAIDCYRRQSCSFWGDDKVTASEGMIADILDEEKKAKNFPEFNTKDFFGNIKKRFQDSPLENIFYGDDDDDDFDDEDDFFDDDDDDLDSDDSFGLLDPPALPGENRSNQQPRAKPIPGQKPLFDDIFNDSKELVPPGDAEPFELDSLLDANMPLDIPPIGFGVNPPPPPGCEEVRSRKRNNQRNRNKRRRRKGKK